MRASMQDFNNRVGIKSREQDASVEERINLRISSGEVGSKEDSTGGVRIPEGAEVALLLILKGMEEHNLVILSSKNLRKEVARLEGESVLGSDLRMLRPSRESRVPQSFLGQF